LTMGCSASNAVQSEAVVNGLPGCKRQFVELRTFYYGSVKKPAHAKCSCHLSCKEEQSSVKPVNLHASSSVNSAKKDLSKLPYIGITKPEPFISNNVLPSRSLYRGSLDISKDPSSPVRDYRANDSKGKAVESPSVMSRHRQDGTDSKEPKTPARGGKPIRKKASRTVLISGIVASDSYADLAIIPGVELKSSNKADKPEENSPSNNGLLKWGTGKDKEDIIALPSLSNCRKRIHSENIEESPAENRRFQEQRPRVSSMVKISHFNPDLSGPSSPSLRMPFKPKYFRPGTFDNLDSPGVPHNPKYMSRGHSLKVDHTGTLKDVKPHTNFLIPEDISDDSQESKKEETSPVQIQAERRSLRFCSSLVRHMSCKQMAEIPEEGHVEPFQKCDTKQDSNAQKTEATREAVHSQKAQRSPLSINQSKIALD